MSEVKFRTSNFGVIKHGEDSYEVIKHVEFFDNKEAVDERIDEICENNQ